MRGIDLYAQILGLSSPWQVVSVAVDQANEEIRVQVAPEPGTRWSCPKCGKPSPGYDSRRRRWRHLDTCQYKTVREADVPRVKCAEHGVVTVAVPWAEPGSGFTALFEALIIDWLKEASIQAVARQLRVSWNAIDAVMGRAVQRGLSRRQGQPPQAISVDETAFTRGHEYVTIPLITSRALSCRHCTAFKSPPRSSRASSDILTAPMPCHHHNADYSALLSNL